MGEYAKLNGYEIKLGTCEDMTYIRREELAGANFEPMDGNATTKAAYLNAPGTFWRFPYPDEDGLTRVSEWQGRTMAARKLVLRAPDWELSEHRAVTVQVPAVGGDPVQGISVGMPCPMELAKLENTAPIQLFNTGKASQLVSPIAQKWMAPDWQYTVFACAFCGHWFSVDDEDILSLVAVNRAIQPEVCARLLGNSRGVAEVAA